MSVHYLNSLLTSLCEVREAVLLQEVISEGAEGVKLWLR